MSNKHKKNCTENGLQKEFDTFTKHTLKNLIRTELRSYIRASRNGCTTYSEKYEEMAGPEKMLNIEKIQVTLGDMQLFLENEHLAEGLKKLKKRHQLVLEYAIVLEMPSEAVMELMDLGVRSIYNYKSEALRILRRHMEESSGEKEVKETR